MKDSWILIDKMSPPRYTSGHILMYTPGVSSDMKYRKIPYSDWEKIREATHWQPCLCPHAEQSRRIFKCMDCEETEEVEAPHSISFCECGGEMYETVL